MGPQAAIPMALTLLLVCADPTGATRHQPAERDLASALETFFLEGREVVASSPLPAGIGVGSHYGERTSTRTGRRTFHAGVDFLSQRGTPVFAVRHGVVEAVASEDSPSRRWAGYGNAVVVRHEQDGRWSFYAHLDSVEVVPGQVIEPGQKLGCVGNTTNDRFPRMVPHLHMEVRRARSDGSSPFPGGYGRHNVDPEAWLAEMGVTFTAPDAAGPMEEPALVLAPVRSEAVAGSNLGVALF